MSRLAYCLILLVSALAFVGCAPGGDDAKYETQAPPPASNAVADTPRVNKNRPGAMGVGGGGAAPAGAPAGGDAGAK